MSGRIFPGFCLALFLIATFHSIALGSEPEDNLARLRAMSRDERERFSKKLAEFDAMEPGQREAIRSLNESLAEAEPESRARYLSVLRRYHVFYQNLPPEKRRAIDQATDPAKKLELIGKYKAEPKRSQQEIRRYADVIQISALSPLRLRELSTHLFVYFKLDPVKDAKDRAELARTNDPVKRRVFVRSLIQSHSLGSLVRQENAEFRIADAKVNKYLDRVESELGKADVERAKRAKLDPAKLGPKTKDEFEKRRRAVLNKLDEIQVFHDFDPTTVESANLDRFEAALPAWARESIDPLPPDAARRRMKVLYRLVFPPGEEMPVSKTPEPVRPNKTPAAPADGSPAPF